MAHRKTYAAHSRQVNASVHVVLHIKGLNRGASRRIATTQFQRRSKQTHPLNVVYNNVAGRSFSPQHPSNFASSSMSLSNIAFCIQRRSIDYTRREPLDVCLLQRDITLEYNCSSIILCVQIFMCAYNNCNSNNEHR